MSILQSPIKALHQIEWYLDNRNGELFPGAYFIAAGNLCRQTLEQILFILAFYSGMPRSKYLRSDGSLKVAGSILAALRSADPKQGKPYLQRARDRGSRIRKFARYPRSLERWKKLFNEPSHFRNPAARRRTEEKDIREFIQRLRAIIDDRDPYLITAAVNELRSNGRAKAALGPEPSCAPIIAMRAVITPKDIIVSDGSLALVTPKTPFYVLPDDRELPHPWPKLPVIVRHSAGIGVAIELVNSHGNPLDVRSFDGILRCLASTPEDRKRLVRRMKQLGFRLEFERGGVPPS